MFLSQSDVLKKYGFKEEVWEEGKDQYMETGYPAPHKRYRVIWEVPNMSLEETYFWMLHYLRDWGYVKVVKTTDTFAAAENSAFFGVSQQRIGLQQDKVSQFLATIGKMVKELFQLVRELRVIDERLEYYVQAMRGVESAEIVLKGIWIDMVEGGTKNPSSVYGMAREVQFTSLPDLFFSTHPKTEAEVDYVVDVQRSGFNKSVRNVLKRKLKTFLIWKDKTLDELKTRRVFTLKYLKQHFDIIKMYMMWVKPYLHHIRRLTLDDEKVLTPDMVSAFEGSMIEVEFLAYKLPVHFASKKANKYYHTCVLVHFLYRTRPSMSYQQEGYQRGPIHVGKMEMNLRGYVWTKEQIEKFRAMRDEQDLDLMKSISESVKAAMEALGDELMDYLKEAETSGKPAPAAPKGIFERIKGKKEEKPKKPKKISKMMREGEIKMAKDIFNTELFDTFKNFKKAHAMLMW
jgi:hypothetical protein